MDFNSALHKSALASTLSPLMIIASVLFPTSLYIDNHTSTIPITCIFSDGIYYTFDLGINLA